MCAMLQQKEPCGQKGVNVEGKGEPFQDRGLTASHLAHFQEPFAQIPIDAHPYLTDPSPPQPTVLSMPPDHILIVD
jgi:hypothetical protein